MLPLTIVGCGMVTGLGLSATATCAALRARVRRFSETDFWFDGARLYGCDVPLRDPVRGRERCLRLLTSAVCQCLPEGGLRQPPVVLLCVPETTRAGRARWLDDDLLVELHRRLEWRASSDSRVLTGGRVAGMRALALAAELATHRQACVVVGVDNFHSAAVLAAYYERQRLFTVKNSNGLRPGEAAAAVLVMPYAPRSSGLVCRGVGLAEERATIDSDEPLRGEGLAHAIRGALKASRLPFERVDYRLADLSGEDYGAREAALALARVMRALKETLPIWLPSESLGEIGAAAVPLMLGWASMAAQRGYAPGDGALIHVSNDDGARGAAILTSGEF